jgi:hypothetical protein
MTIKLALRLFLPLAILTMAICLKEVHSELCKERTICLLSANLQDYKADFMGEKSTILVLEKQSGDFRKWSIYISDPRIKIASEGSSVIFRDNNFSSPNGASVLNYSFSPAIEGNESAMGNSVTICDSVFSIKCKDTLSADSITYYLICLKGKAK